MATSSSRITRGGLAAEDTQLNIFTRLNDRSQKSVLTDGTQDVTATASGGKVGLDVNINSGSITVTIGTVAQDFGVSTTALRTAALIGNSSGAAAFGAGTTTAQTLRVVLPTDQTVIPVSQSGTWSTGRTWTLASGTDSVSAVQSGTWTVQQGSAPWSVSQSGAWSVTANAGTNLNTSLLALDTSVNGILLAQASTTSGQTGPLIQGAVTTAAPTYTTAKTSPLSLTTTGLLRVDNSGVTQPVSGTVAVTQSTSPWVANVTQFGSNNVATGTGASGVGVPRVTVANDSNILATQSGTWTVQPGNTQNTTAWLVQDTATNTSAATAATRGMQVMGVFNTSPATLSSGQSGFLQLDSAQDLLVKVNVALPTGANTIGAVTQASGPWTSNVTQFGSSNIVTGTGTSGSGIPRVTVSNDSNVLVTQSTSPWVVAGNVASAASDSGNPVKVGGVFNTTQPTVTTAQRVDLQATARGAQIVATGVDNFNINNVSGTVSLPTGAATSGNQTTEITSLQIIDDLPLAQGSTTSGQTGPIVQGAVTTAAPSYTTAKTNPLSLTTTGDLRVAAASLPLPAGAATAARQDAQTSDLNILAGAIYTSGGGTGITSAIAIVAQENGAGGSAVGTSVTSAGAQWVNNRDNSGNEVGITAAPLKVRISDGTNQGPSMDAVSRPGFQKITDGTNTMPTMDTAGRAGVQKLTDASGIYNVSLAIAAVSGIGFCPTLLYDSLLHNAIFKSTGEFPVHAGSTNNTLANSTYLKSLSDGTLLQRTSDNTYNTVAVSQTDQVLGATGATGDYLKFLIVTVATAATGTCSIKDGGGGVIPITAATTVVGVYSISIGAVSTGGAWKVTTGAGATAIAVGRFT
jgi:hypothetical protein